MDSLPPRAPVGRPGFDGGDQLDFDCPRCRQPTSGRFYGPCPHCVAELRSQLTRDTEPVTAPEYEPKMNVTPNAVATKD